MAFLAEELKAEGNKAFGNQEYKKAAKIYRDAIKLDPSSPVLYSNRAQCFIKLKDFDRAIRDCGLGLELESSIQLQTKLNYRKGLAHKNLGEYKYAQACFQKALELEPSNGLAREELRLVSNSNAQSRKKAKIESSAFEIPIEDVPELPEHFRRILDPHPNENETHKKIPGNTPLSKETEEIAEDIFKDRKKKTRPHASPSPGTQFVERLSMHFLAGLKSLPQSQKAKGYQYVLLLDISELGSTFRVTGVDAEFLEFYLEAVANSLSENSERWKTEALEKLQYISALKRFTLSLEFCDDEVIQSILSLVENLHDSDLLHTYRTVLKK